MIMTELDKDIFKNSKTCHICEKPLNKPVRHHCHLTGKFRGPAYEDCNLGFNYKNCKLPVVFHNLKGYDSHFILQYVGL